ncbi:hypothetical protein AVM11_08720 [Sphingomonas melonis TY]|uniref:Uncharacterized protein n=1 Tax=Sphingomonas melonis TY TaxID=621456 RepID=A0A175Y044_9SPHN|nr:hypothetical protein BJP26_00660 [Sphingomonas melonis TY]KZB94077.1 hypothetical protein AVM11_08720 [Sphingomonas melonis TY]
MIKIKVQQGDWIGEISAEAVPRVGDTVYMQNDQPGKVVTAVMWGRAPGDTDGPLFPHIAFA